jgi:hypothetical protein
MKYFTLTHSDVEASASEKLKQLTRVAVLDKLVVAQVVNRLLVCQRKLKRVKICPETGRERP